MKSNRVLKLNKMIAIALCICLFGGTTGVYADVISSEISLGGASYYLNRYYDKNSEADASASLLADPVSIPENVAIVININDHLNIRKGAGTTYGVVGYLPNHGMCIVLSEETNDKGEHWAKIQSGSVTGYVSTAYLAMGDEGRKLAEEQASLLATVNAGTVNFRSNPSTASSKDIITTVTKGEVLKVIEETVINKEDDNTLWVKVYVDDMEGYVCKDFVDVAYDWPKAVSMTSIVGASAAVNLSALRAAIIIEAKKHLGLKYVWGGNSLVTGADCSGFVLQVYKACGIDISQIPRTSYDMAAYSKGTKVSLANAKPGDLVFYGDSDGNINHVAMYIGNNQIIHESGHVYGCKVSNVNYRKIVKIMNFID